MTDQHSSGGPASNPIQHLLSVQRAVVLDGALATELERRGADLNDPLWSARVLIEQPELIRAVHADYFAAGADIATTASYQATFEGFARRGLDQAQAAALMKKSIALACEARDAFWADPLNRTGRERPLVAASVGPYGAMLADGSEYRGDYALSEEQLMDFHRPRLKVLIDAGADLLACETLPCLAEARALARLLTEFPGVYAWISFSCRDELTNCQGEPFADCVAELEQFEQIVALGINCSAPAFVGPLLASARKVSNKPLLTYPNSGESYDPERKCWHGIRDAAGFADAARGWFVQGARVIGGCCRTTPDDIRALAHWVRLP
jgi:homocysteine S-methyltransferase